MPFFSPLVKTRLIDGLLPMQPRFQSNILSNRRYCGGVFEQLARYTARYQESDLHLGLYSSYSSYNFCLLYYYSTFPTLFTSSSVVAVLIAKAGRVWVSWPEEFLLYFFSLTLQQVCYCQGID